MNIRSKTYRFFSALALMLFLSSAVLPGTLAAASLFCDMAIGTNTAEMQADDHACCDIHEHDQQPDRDSTFSLDDQPCNYQQVCPHILPKEQTEVQAIPQISKDFAAIFVNKKISDWFPNLNSDKPFREDTIIRKFHPPLFLLNSVFLN